MWYQDEPWFDRIQKQLKTDATSFKFRMTQAQLEWWLSVQR
jgi:hypothetical protein